MGLESLVNLNSLEELCEEFDRHQRFEIEGKMRCPRCARENRFVAKWLKVTANREFASEVPRAKSITSGGYNASWTTLRRSPGELLHSSFRFTCVTCNTSAISIVYGTPERPVLLVLFSQSGSIATDRTPETVRYFLEQAYLCNSMKAYSATLAMYRTALDALLFNQGFTDGMVGQKLRLLEEKIESGTAPSWAAGIEKEYLAVIKNLGNSSLHISTEDITREREISDAAIHEVELAFNELLDRVYEHEARQRERLEKLKAIEDRKTGKS